MGERLFRYKGRVVDPHGVAVPQAVVALVDEDMISDDLIGATLTGDDGRFAVTFSPEAFNQELLERESSPDLYVVVSLPLDGALRAVGRRSFAGRSLGRDEDLGDIVLERREAGFAPLDGQAPMPGGDKRARRLRLDDELLARTLGDVAPLVESLTGARGLLDGLGVVASDGLGETMLRMNSEIVPTPTSGGRAERAALRLLSSGLTAFLSRRMRLVGVVALYDPYARQIVFDRPAIERVGYDSFRAILGHELVHAAQFKAHPALVDEFKEINHQMLATVDEPEGSPEALEKARVAQLRLLRFSANIEGHATHLEHDFLRRAFSAHLDLPHAGLFEQAVWRISAAMSEGDQPSLVEREAAKTALPYQVGLAAYRERAEGGQPAPFDPAFRPEADAPA